MPSGFPALVARWGLLEALFSNAALPDRTTTPGTADPRVTQTNIQTTICRPRYARSVRPPYAITRRLKRDAMIASGRIGVPYSDYELNHLVALSIGGEPLDRRNLWLEPNRGIWNASHKDELEYVLWADVCYHGLPLAIAQQAMASDWIAAYRRYVAGKLWVHDLGSWLGGNGQIHVWPLDWNSPHQWRLSVIAHPSYVGGNRRHVPMSWQSSSGVRSQKRQNPQFLSFLGSTVHMV